MSLDLAQRELALDPSQSFLVQAPAGSGKTELLTQRFLRLLATVQEPEEILAITFTKKASSEMRSRIRDALKRAQEEPLPTKAHEQKTWRLAKEALSKDKEKNWGLLSNPNRLRIKTIDAFNSLLTRQLPLLSHFGAPPEIVDHSRLLYREAVKSFLLHLEEKVEWSQAIAHLLLHLDNNMKEAETRLAELLGKRDQWLPHIISPLDKKSLRHKLESNLATVIREQLRALQGQFSEATADELKELVDYAAANLQVTKPDSPLLQAAACPALPGTEPSDLPAWLGLCDLLLTKEETWRKSFTVTAGFPPAPKKKTPEADKARIYKERIELLVEHLSGDEKLRSSLAEVRYLPQAEYSESQWKILEALQEVLKLVVAQLALLFKQSGKIDYTENAQAALMALGSEEAPTDLALVLDYQIRHLLVDEFQDTSNNQFHLLEKLVQAWQEDEGRTLFLVGDPMQSIYRFREAEVGLFIKARQEGLGPIPLQPLRLSVNFRSEAPIVAWINQHFKRVLPSFDDLGSGAISYTPSLPKDEQADACWDKAVTLHAFVDAERQAQANQIVHILQEAMAGNTEESIAVLVRSRSHLAELIPALKRAKLPYQAVELDPLAERPLIQDLLTLTRALLYPADRLAWLALLRSPSCGLTLKDLLLISNRHPERSEGPQAKLFICSNLQKPDIFSSLSQDGQERLKRILPVLQSALADNQREDLHVTLETAWTLLGGPACAEQESDLREAKTFFALLKKVSQQAKSAGLLWEALQSSIEHLHAQTSTTSRLQIMTIHNAKGLEFDTLIIPHLERGTVGNEQHLLTWMERPQGRHQEASLLLAPIQAAGEKPDKIYQHLQRQDKVKTQHESGRLLYVAVTRAKKNLHLLMSLTKNSKGEVKAPREDSLLHPLWPALASQLKPQTAPMAVLPDTLSKRQLKRLKTSWKNPVLPPPLPERPPHNKVQGFHLMQSEAKSLGLVVHRLLQELSERGLAWWTSKSAEQRNPYLQRLLLENGALPSTLEAQCHKVSSALEKVLADPRGPWILQQAEARSEWKLSAVFEKSTKLLIIDRTFIDEEGVRWLIDYKTTVPGKQQSLESFLVAEREKHSQQLQAYAQALQGLDSRPLKIGLYFPLLPHWLEG